MKLLLVIDMQNDFIDGSLGTTEAVAIVPRVIEKVKNSLKYFLYKGNGVFFFTIKL